MLTFRGLRARVAGSAINHRAQRCRHSSCDGAPAPRNDIELIDFDATDERVVHYRCKRNHELAARIRRLRELLDVGDVLPTSRFDDVEVGQYLRAVDGDVERARAGRGEKGFGKVQPYGMARSGSKARNRVGERL